MGWAWEREGGGGEGVMPWLNEATARAEASGARAAGGPGPLQGLIRSRFKRRKHAALQISQRRRRPPPLNNVHTAGARMQGRGGGRARGGEGARPTPLTVHTELRENHFSLSSGRL